MGKLFETITLDEAQIAAQVKANWDLTLSKCLKASQNHTYLAESSEGKPYIIRVTPDPHGTRKSTIELEVELLNYLHRHNLPVCPAIPSKLNQQLIVDDNGVLIIAFQYAVGEPVNYIEWKWMTERDHVVGVGRWTAKLHKLTKQFVLEYPELCARARHWTELHDGVLANTPVHEDDKAVEGDPNHFGLVHGDINPSNYFWDPTLQLPCMFDFDQVQRSWFIFDLAQPIWAVVTLEQAGSPIDYKPVPEANVKQFTDWLLEGYESESGIKVDRNALRRMVDIKARLYLNFCTRALEELDPESFMGKFCKFMADWLTGPNGYKFE